MRFTSSSRLDSSLDEIRIGILADQGIQIIFDAVESLGLSQVGDLAGGTLPDPGPADRAVAGVHAHRAHPVGVLESAAGVLAVAVVKTDTAESA